ncbi:indole-3-glycerol phosphate synthase TrpC [Fuchsiella alkaliacetigena]|uniref:indole-3-glycerol phosphate synthase TrpC n=1 Tax=Fuchsiella alkaliacetigena TaxID=957042 RepID=UPI00200B77F9|nr:indole-3-glycerol phosphate synthase TrpC [Fuchsiella alkaliacetigena]MCK8825896.1 indole-3-glycerol phosphate synthase TrpC [Fuchsiella alkaliacetigena]
MFLEKIIENTKQEVAAQKDEVSLAELKAKLRAPSEIKDFKTALLEPGMSLIAEVKKASPSKGVIREDFNPVQIASAYEEYGAAAISVLTDSKYFQGSLDYLTAIKEQVKLPLLRKDFIVDPYQLYEAQAAGADAVLLIVAVLSFEKLQELLSLAEDLGLAALVEVHSEDELRQAVEAEAEIIGINNRDLVTFETDIQQTLDLQELLPEDRVTVSESGISSGDDVELLAAQGIDGILVGEALMRSADLAKKIEELNLTGSSI